MAMHEIQVFVLVDEDGNWVAGDADQIGERYDEEIGGSASVARRCVQITLKIDVECMVEMEGTAPPQGKPTLTVK